MDNKSEGDRKRNETRLSNKITMESILTTFVLANIYLNVICYSFLIWLFN